MKIWKWIFIVTLSALAAVFSFREFSSPLISGVSFASFLFIAFIAVFGEEKIFPKYNGEKIAYTGLGALVGLLLFFLPFSGIVPISISFGLDLVGVFLGGLFGLAYAKKLPLKHSVSSNGNSIAQQSSQPSLLTNDALDAKPLTEATITTSKDKILDTSVIIDGRILEIADTHFLDGPLILPNFVLREIQLISDSSDPIKRARGRRGLDMLNKLQKKGSIEVKITYKDFSDTREVDQKLIKLARETGGSVITNDFNLNKVAELQKVRVLNLNTLANALRPVVLPGEEFTITVIKEGKDENQGIGYLEDGTMVVIENGGSLVSREVKVAVTSVIQTAAGKMIFTKVHR